MAILQRFRNRTYSFSKDAHSVYRIIQNDQTATTTTTASEAVPFQHHVTLVWGTRGAMVWALAWKQSDWAWSWMKANMGASQTFQKPILQSPLPWYTTVRVWLVCAACVESWKYLTFKKCVSAYGLCRLGAPSNNYDYYLWPNAGDLFLWPLLPHSLSCGWMINCSLCWCCPLTVHWCCTQGQHGHHWLSSTCCHSNETELTQQCHKWKTIMKELIISRLNLRMKGGWRGETALITS